MCVLLPYMLNCCLHEYSTRSTHCQVFNTRVGDFLGGRKQEVVLKQQESHWPHRSPELNLYKLKSIFVSIFLYLLSLVPFLQDYFIYSHLEHSSSQKVPTHLQIYGI